MRETLDKEQQNLVNFLCRYTEYKINKNFCFSKIFGEIYLTGYSKVVGIFKKDALFLKSLMNRIIYKSSVPYLSLEFVDNGEFLLFSGFNYLKILIKVALKILGNEEEILIRVPISEIAPLLLFSNKNDYTIIIAPIIFQKK